jgi:type II secretory pathway component PulF
LRHEAVQSLPEHQRIVTTLFYIDGYSQREAAEILGVPLTTVKKRLHDSRERLRERMGVKMPKQAAAKRADFWKVLGSLADCGMPLLKILDIALQAADEKLKGVIPELGESLRKGESLPEAMERHGKVFSAARKAGMRTFREDAMAKLASGIISFEEGVGKAAVEGRFR